MTLTQQPASRPYAPPGPNGWLVIGGILTALTVVLGGLSAAGWLARHTEVQSRSYPQSASSLSIDLDSGDLTVSTGEAGTVSVTRRLHWSFHKPTFDERWDGRSLAVHSTCDGAFWPGPDCGVDYTLQVPPGASVTAHTGSGDIELHNIDGELHLRTGSGDITGTGLTSATIDASTGSGDIELRSTAAPGGVTAHTGSGDIEIAVPSGEAYAVRTRTGSGDVDIRVQRNDTSTRSISADSGSGDIEIRYA